MKKKTKFYFGIGFIILILISWFLPEFLSRYNINYQTISLKVILFCVILLLVLTIFFMYIFFKNKNFNEYYDNLKKVFAVLTIIIAIIEVIILSNQTSILSVQAQIQNTQNQILKQTSQSNFPDLYLSSSQGYQSYPIDSFNNYPQRIAVGVTNIGKSIAPFVDIKIVDGLFRGWEEKTKDDFRITNLNSLDYNATFFDFWIFNYTNIKSPQVPGKLDIPFMINCPFSQDPIKFQNITICIYSSYDNITKECGEEWKYR
jgi:hypothetical protein